MAFSKRHARIASSSCDLSLTMSGGQSCAIDSATGANHVVDVSCAETNALQCTRLPDPQTVLRGELARPTEVDRFEHIIPCREILLSPKLKHPVVFDEDGNPQ